MFGFHPIKAPGQRPKAFTLVEVMVVVVIIGLLAAAGLPGYRHLTMRSKVTALENDLRQFSTAAQTYALQQGRWPDDGDPQLAPPELANALPNNFTLRTPIGGVYKWSYSTDGNIEGVSPAKAAIVILTVGDNHVDDDVEMLEMIDKQMDDGNLTTGLIQGGVGAFVYVIEK
jgi:prepilin-type N-terminal cleavage/methylation domain-containing protein